LRERPLLAARRRLPHTNQLSEKMYINELSAAMPELIPVHPAGIKWNLLLDALELT